MLGGYDSVSPHGFRTAQAQRLRSHAYYHPIIVRIPGRSESVNERSTVGGPHFADFTREPQHLIARGWEPVARQQTAAYGQDGQKARVTNGVGLPWSTRPSASSDNGQFSASRVPPKGEQRFAR